MARSGPDWGHAAPTSASYALTDLAELAARQGSPVLYDRRGKVLWYDDCYNDGEQWGTITQGADSDANYASAVPALSWGSALQIDAGPAEDDYCEAFHHHTYAEVSPMGLSLAFFHDSKVKEYWWMLDVSEGTGYYRAAIRLVVGTGQLYYLDSEGHWQTLAVTTCIKYNLATYGYYFNHLKLVMDPETGDYVRFLFNNESYDLSAYTMPWTGIDSLAYVRGAIYVLCDDGGKATIYVDNVIFTVEET